MSSEIFVKLLSDLKLVAAALLTLALAHLVIKLVKEIRNRQELLKVFDRGNVPSLPNKSLISGNLFQLYVPDNNIKIMQQLHEQLGKTYGTFYGPQPWAISCDADLIFRIFKKEAYIDINLFELPFVAELNKSLAQMHEAGWRPLRKALNPSFTVKQMKSDGIYRDIEKANQSVLNCIAGHPVEEDKSKGKSRVVDVLYNAKKYAIEVVFNVAYGKANGVNMEPLGRDVIIDNIHEASKLIKNPMVWLSILSGGKLQRILGFFIKFTLLGSNISFLHNIMAESVEARRRMSPGELSQNRKMIDSIIECVTRSNLDDETLKANLFFLFVAGFETTANTMAIMFWLLAKHPDKQEKLRQSVLIDNEDSEYLTWCVKETLRLYPAVPTGIGRIIPEDIQHEGMTFYKGTAIIANIYSVHHSRDYWGDDVEEFRPERFGQSNLHPAQYIPFALGPRACLGYNLAMLELRTMTARLIVRYKLEECSTTPDELKYTSPNLIHMIIDHSIDLRFIEISTV